VRAGEWGVRGAWGRGGDGVGRGGLRGRGARMRGAEGSAAPADVDGWFSSVVVWGGGRVWFSLVGTNSNPQIPNLKAQSNTPPPKP